VDGGSRSGSSSSSRSSSGGSSIGTGAFHVVQQPLLLLRTLASVLLLLPAPGQGSRLDSHVNSTANLTLLMMQMVLSISKSDMYAMQGTAAAAASPVAEALLPLLLHSVVPAVVAMMEQSSSAKAAAAGTVPGDSSSSWLSCGLCWASGGASGSGRCDWQCDSCICVPFTDPLSGTLCVAISYPAQLSGAAIDCVPCQL
jgi:hypothetical protein